MDLGSVIGMLIGIMLITGAIASEGNVAIYLSLNGFMIAFGGVVASIFIAYPLSDIFRVFKFVKTVFLRREACDLPSYVDLFEEFARIVRREGPISMERAMDRFDNEFYRQGCQLVADGISSDKLEEILTKDIEAMDERHKVGRELFHFGMQAGPAFGLIGAVIGIIQMLAALATGETGPVMIARMAAGMSLALCATLYGITLAYLIFAPISSKLANRSDEEINEKQMFMEGFLALQANEPAQMVRQRMEVFMPPNLRRSQSKEAQAVSGGRAAAGL